MTFNISNFVYKVLVPIAAAMVSGIFVWFMNPGWEKTAREHGWVSQPEWTMIAKEKGWIPKEECPAFPVRLTLNSPGADAQVKYYISGDKIVIRTPIVVGVSKPVNEKHRIGIILKYGKNKNVYVVFPDFKSTDSKVFTTRDSSSSMTFLPLGTSGNDELTFQACLVENDSVLGDVYGNFAQITSNPLVLAASEQLTVSLMQEK